MSESVPLTRLLEPTGASVGPPAVGSKVAENETAGGESSKASGDSEPKIALVSLGDRVVDARVLEVGTTERRLVRRPLHKLVERIREIEASVLASSG